MPLRRIADLVLESAIDYAIITLDLKGVITSWSKGAEAIMGWSEDEILGKPAETFFTPEDRTNKIPQTEMGNALTEGRGLDERWHLRKDGQRFFALGEMMPLKNEDGPVEGFLKILRDRTSQKLAEAALVEAQQELYRAQKVGGVGTFSVEIESDDLKGSPEFFRLYGFDERGCSIKDLERVFHPDDRHLATNERMRSLGDGEGTAEYRIVLPGTQTVRWIARKAEYERDGDSNPLRLIGTVQDITERKHGQELQTTINYELSHPEMDGPTVIVSERKGFGSRLIKGGIAGTRSQVDVIYDPTGLKCLMTVPVSDTENEH